MPNQVQNPVVLAVEPEETKPKPEISAVLPSQDPPPAAVEPVPLPKMTDVAEPMAPAPGKEGSEGKEGQEGQKAAEPYPLFEKPATVAPGANDDGRSKKEEGHGLPKGVAAGVAALVFLVAGTLAIVTRGFFFQRGEEVAPPATTLETRATADVTQTVVLPKFTSEQCPWGQGDNLSPQGGKARARLEKSVNFSPTCPISTLKAATITSSRSQDFLYDDSLFLLFDGKILGGFNTFFPPLTLGGMWDWLKAVDTEQDSTLATTQFVCAVGSPCSVPRTRKSKSGGSTEAVNIGLTGADLAGFLSLQTSHTFTAIVSGDNNPDTDCQMTEDLTLSLTFDGSTCEPTATPTPPTVSANCASLVGQISDGAGGWLTKTDADFVAAAKPGERVRFMCTGSKSSGSFTKSAFFINSVLHVDDVVKLNETQFIVEYTIPAAGALKVESVLLHDSKGWVD